jgi:hypothetical protein
MNNRFNNTTKKKAVTKLLTIAGTAVCILSVGVALASAQSNSRMDFEFTNVADSTQGFTNFSTFPAINNSGSVAFVAFQNGVSGVFRSRNGEVTTIASGKEGFGFFGIAPSVNASGFVAFVAGTATGSTAIFSGDGQTRTLIADSAANQLLGRAIGDPSINAAGTVAFSAPTTAPGLPGNIFMGRGGPLTTLLTVSGTGFSGFANVAINDAGKIAFHGFLPDGNEGIFEGASSPAAVVTTKTNPELGRGFIDPVINNSGTIADIGFLTSGGVAVVTGNVRSLTVSTDPIAAAIEFSEHPSLNNHGAVAFAAASFSNPNAPTGIFLHLSGGQSLIPVIRPGDKLFGSIVQSVDLGRFALNERFELAFQYTLNDGRSGVAIAAFHGEREEDGQQQ